MTQELLSVKQVAAALHLSPRAVQHRITAGKINATKVGEGLTSGYVVTRSEVERILAERATVKVAS